MRNFLGLALALGFIVAGMNHFYMPSFYMPLMPGYLPWHYELILVSGACEVFLGALFLFPASRKLAGAGLILLLLAVFPANIHMAIHKEVYPDVSLLFRWGRLPVQAILIAFVYWAAELSYARRHAERDSRGPD